MKQKLRQYLKLTAIFASGIAVGILIMCYLSMRAGKTFVEAFRSLYYNEQITLAADAHSKKDKYAEYIYRHNIVDSYPYGGSLKVFDSAKNEWTFGFPFAALILDRIYNTPGIEKGRKIGYATELGRLAAAAENIGLQNEAQKMWSESAQLIGWNDVDRMRKFVGGLHEIDENYRSGTCKEK